MSVQKIQENFRTLSERLTNLERGCDFITMALTGSERKEYRTPEAPKIVGFIPTVLREQEELLATIAEVQGFLQRIHEVIDPSMIAAPGRVVSGVKPVSLTNYNAPAGQNAAQPGDFVKDAMKESSVA